MPPSEPWTTRRLLAWMHEAFTKRGLDSPRLSAEILLSSVLACPRLELYTQQDRPASPEERDRLRDLARRALDHEPIQYLTGEAWFFALPFIADRRALIPRPSTETIVEHLLQAERARDRDAPPRIADVCTGSGCIAVAIARNLPAASVVASDISPDALALARENAERHGVANRIEFLEGNLLEPLAHHAPFDWIVSNPPYIPDHEWDAVEPNVKDHEPHLALRGGPDGMAFVAPLIRNAGERLAPAGGLLIELAACTAADAASLAARHGWRRPVILKDHEGLDRVLAATAPSGDGSAP
jgi:release factor glutamine methyltransferase